ncbi:hypothetical protein IPJ91_03040 [bacterium]|nr:MAG: hypothetical protein IPJ91_03040 [bacterium]
MKKWFLWNWHNSRKRTFDCNLIGIEITHEAINLTEFIHPKRAIYIIDAEDDGLPVEVLKACNETFASMEKEV